eukprot:TRINITY_DN17323_c0_g1_i1.p1 TRINITY_DN17323_c0_g1~~TRINITY_DN17323_c0_g1_i1.p1  ORF type:complete len:513 (+),score=152.43 TRINITY_DN17323_c0_g1_i1:63-1541(+)
MPDPTPKRRRTAASPAVLDFKGWEWRGRGAVEFRFQCSGKLLRHVVRLPGLQQADLDRSCVRACLQGIGLSVAPWLWQARRPPVIRISAGSVDAFQLEFWKVAYTHAIGEWLWVNRGRAGVPVAPSRKDGRGSVADPATLFTLEARSATAGPPVPPAPLERRGSSSRRVLLPLGGGKDSLVLYERMRRVGIEPDFMFLCNDEGEWKKNWRYQAVADAAKDGDADVVVAESILKDKDKLEDMRDATDGTGFLWGALVAFTSALTACVHGYDVVSVGNERSANAGNGVLWGDQEVNHQYDKGQEFERAMQEYITRYIAGGVRYFSGLADLWEIQIARMFCSTPKYLPLFISCNVGNGEWCGRCAKCCFVYVLLSAFAPAELVTDVERRVPSGCRGAPPFAGDMLSDRRLFGTFDTLAGWGQAKPMDCVGTPDEVRLALYLLSERVKEAGAALPAYFKHRPEVVESGAALTAMLSDTCSNHSFPEWYRDGCVAAP